MNDTMPSDITIFHNPACGTSRNVLGLIRNAGIEPVVVEYLKTPPSRAQLRAIVAATGGSILALLREKGTPCHELGLADPATTDEQILDAMLAHPILINRPIVISARGTRLCRPSETVLDLLPAAQRGAYTKEDGQPVVDEDGRPVG